MCFEVILSCLDDDDKLLSLSDFKQLGVKFSKFNRSPFAKEVSVTDCLLGSPILVSDTFRFVSLNTESISKGSFSMLNFNLNNKVVIQSVRDIKLLEVKP